MGEVKSIQNTDITISEQVMVGNDLVMNLTASIRKEDPKQMSYGFTITNRDLYFKNRDEIHGKQAAFEDRVYEQQQKMIAEGGNLS